MFKVGDEVEALCEKVGRRHRNVYWPAIIVDTIQVERQTRFVLRWNQGTVHSYRNVLTCSARAYDDVQFENTT